MTASHPLPVNGTEVNAPTAKLEAGAAASDCVVKVGGDWRLNSQVPSWNGLFGQHIAANVRVIPDDLGKWDTSLLLFLVHGRAWCAESKRDFIAEALPENLQTLLRQVAEAGTAAPKTKPAAKTIVERADTLATNFGHKTKENISFIGECTLGFVGVLKHPRRFRWMDCLVEMQQCWASSLPIVSLVSFLVGVILAFQAAIQLQQYGAAVFVADLVGLSVVREMGPMMAAVIMAGGIGAAFAAQLGNMKVDEEIDALETLGISTVDFLALPRLFAVTLMMPILALYANVLGILGGMFVSATMLNIPAAAYWVETQNRVGLSDVNSGVIKSLFFGLAIGLAGCLRGMKCERSAAGVGKATTSAVVTGILLIVIADALFALIFNVLGI
ncbi:MAG: ABC transporter permease [Verrucomicrobia bacterium]|jgi:phospholipid/cholesterol/gamma-HCH transport system permease protein|nr:ABC transporter permease [Verrucomicrobiota bacterium]